MDLHSFHKSDSTLCWYVALIITYRFVNIDTRQSKLLDILAHRQLSAAIGYSPLHATLHSKSHVERVLDVVNRRHRMAQMAGRASVEFYVGLALKGCEERERKVSAVASQEGQVTEEAFVIRTFRNGLDVFYEFYL